MKYTLDCNYINKEFNNISSLLDYVTENGVDPNLTILKNGKTTHEMVIDLIQF